MATQTLSHFLPRIHAPAPAREERRPFLEALQRLEYGHMTVITPEGNRLEFTGPKKGPAAMLRLYDWKALDELVTRGEVGFADAYIAGRCDSNNLPALLTVALMNAPVLERFFHGRPLYVMAARLRNFFHTNDTARSRRNVMAHYDLGNDFYRLWLDEGLTYSCGLFEGDETRSLEAAQLAKYRRILGKLGAQPGDRILEIGCGWGGFAEAAARDGITVTGLTLSAQQAEFARERIHSAGLDHLANIELKDYREVEGTFDHIVSIGMFEHVGERCWGTYFATVRKHLRKGGKAMIQTITLDDDIFEKTRGITGFIEEYIFPGGMLPSRSRFNDAAKSAGLNVREMYAFGGDYALTLRHWLGRFEAHKQQIRDLGYDEPFMRLWRFYLASCIASFVSHRSDVMQAEVVHAG